MILDFATFPGCGEGVVMEQDRADVVAFRDEVMCQAKPACGKGQRRQAASHSADPWT